jgi:hypothetical protein
MLFGNKESFEVSNLRISLFQQLHFLILFIPSFCGTAVSLCLYASSVILGLYIDELEGRSSLLETRMSLVTSGLVCRLYV